MEQNKYFKKDRKKLIHEFEEHLRLFPEDELSETLLLMIKRSTPENLCGGLSHFVVDTPGMNEELNEKVLLFEQKYRKPRSRF